MSNPAADASPPTLAASACAPVPATWSLERGAQLLADDAVRFSVWAPHAKSPRVRVCTGNARGEYALTPNDAVDGEYTATIANVGANAEYAFLIDGVQSFPDPVSRSQPRGVHDASRVIDPRAFKWTDASWRGVSLEEAVIYELHVGTFTTAGTFTAIIDRLAALRTLGVTAIELMPVAQFAGERNWGYDGVGLYAVQNSYGGPDALKQLVDAAHAVGLGVLLDVVYNHLGPEGNYLDTFGPYFTDKYTTPWGRAINYDDAHSDEVRRFVVDNARFWIDEYHLDGLRLDAVHGIFDFSARHILREIAESVHAQAALAGRSVVVIGESDLNDPKLLRPPEEFGYGLDAQWSDDFHHAVHAALTGESKGYYADYHGVAHVAHALREPFLYAGDRSTYRRRKHGAPSTGIPRRRFVVAIQNHDQVGNRAAGERLSTLVAPARLRLAAALLLLSPYVPLLFMGEEYGETNPFLYFVSHTDAELIEAIRTGRCKEFESFSWGSDVPDPASAETFARSRIDWAKATAGAHAQLLSLYRDLLALRRDEPLMRPDGARITVADGESGWITVLREPIDDSIRTVDGDTAALLAIFNGSEAAVCVPIPESSARAWTLRLHTDAAGYGGTAEVASEIDVAVDGPRRLLGGNRPTVTIPPWSAAVYAAVYGPGMNIF